MNIKKTTTFVVFSVLLLSALITNCNAPKPKKIKANNCDNAFVVSDYDQIYLFEHNGNSVDFKLLAQYENNSNRRAFYDCQRNIIVSSYGAKGARRDKGGITIFDLNNGSSRDYEIRDGINGQVGRYKNGVFLLTKLIKNTRVKPESGYVFQRQIIPKDFVLENQKDFPKKVVEDYKAGKLWKSFTHTHFFDFDRREITASYQYFVDYTHATGDALFVETSEGILEVNLKTGYAEKLLEHKTTFAKRGVFESYPAMSTALFNDAGQYWITSLYSWDAEYGPDSQKLLNYEKNTIYRIENEKLIKVVTSPYKDMRYVVAPDDNLYIFAPTSKKVARFNLKTKKLREYDLVLPIPKNWCLDSVGYTKENFIIAVSWPGYSTGGMFVVSRDFSKVGKLYELPMGSMDVATSRNIQTRHGRAINSHLCGVSPWEQKQK